MSGTDGGVEVARALEGRGVGGRGGGIREGGRRVEGGADAEGDLTGAKSDSSSNSVTSSST